MLVRHETTIRTRVAVVIAAIFTISVLHLLTPISMLHWHNIFQHLYYLPIVFGALSFGWRGGLARPSPPGLSQMPHILHLGPGLNYSEDLIWEIPLFCAAGVLTGVSGRTPAEAARALQQTTARLTEVYQELQDNFESMKRAERLYAIGQLVGRPGARDPQSARQHRRRGRDPAAESDAARRKTANAWPSSTRNARLNRLLTNFLEFARPRTPHYQTVDAVRS